MEKPNMVPPPDGEPKSTTTPTDTPVATGLPEDEEQRQIAEAMLQAGNRASTFGNLSQPLTTEPGSESATLVQTQTPATTSSVIDNRTLREKYFATRGSFVGYSHTGLRGQIDTKPNQDSSAWAIAQNKDGHESLIFVVTDGCGDEKLTSSHVGSKIIAETMATALKEFESDENFYTFKELLNLAKERVLKVIEVNAKAMAGGSDVNATILDTFLATVLVAVVREDRWVIATIGDGVYAVNGKVKIIPSFKNNAPPYMAYALVPVTMRTPGNYDFVIREEGLTFSLDNLLLGTDGLAEIEKKKPNGVPMISTLLKKEWVEDSGKFQDWLKEVQAQTFTPSAKAQSPSMIAVSWNFNFPTFEDDVTAIIISRKDAPKWTSYQRPATPASTTPVFEKIEPLGEVTTSTPVGAGVREQGQVAVSATGAQKSTIATAPPRLDQQPSESKKDVPQSATEELSFFAKLWRLLLTPLSTIVSWWKQRSEQALRPADDEPKPLSKGNEVRPRRRRRGK